MKLRLLLLLAPLMIVVGVLLTLEAIHPPASGDLVLNDSKQLGIKLSANEEVYLDAGGLDRLTEVVLRNVEVRIEAARITIEGVPNRDFQAIVLEPWDELQLSHDLPKPSDRKISFLLAAKSSANLLLTHRSDQEAGFYVDFNLPKDNECKLRLSYDQQPAALMFTVKGARIKNLIEPGADYITSTSKNQGLEIRVLKSGADQGASLSVVTGTQGVDNFLSARFDTQKEGDKVAVFQDSESQALRASTLSATKVSGQAQLFVDGAKTAELNDVDLVVAGDDIRVQSGISGTAKGLSTKLKGTFSYVGLKPQGQGASVANGDNASNYSKSLLPSLLGKISPFYAILFGAIAYLIDKLVTVHKFLNPGEERS